MITTERLTIRKALESDAEFVAEIQTDEKVQMYMGGVIVNFEKTLSHIKSNPKLLNNFYIILLQSSEEKIGLLSFPLNNEINENELSIEIMPLYFFKGYGAEALSSMRDFWLVKYNKNHLYTTVYPENKESISMLESNGFKYIKKYKERSILQLLYKYEKPHNNALKQGRKKTSRPLA